MHGGCPPVFLDSPSGHAAEHRGLFRASFLGTVPFAQQSTIFTFIIQNTPGIAMFTDSNV
jgi:hypothetical protein